ncbi:MAG: hypothetical protein HY560_00955 [Gemmatimonadetes bacterium]|nr:hypothetical protein [Gemmatimonadota bacterium]
MRVQLTAVTAALLALGSSSARGQYPPGEQGSRNVHVLFHIPSVGASDIRVDQDLARPYVYQPHGRPAGYHVIDVKDPRRASIMYSWNIENPELHEGNASGVMLFKHRGRHYQVLSVQFGQTGPDAEVVAIVFDVTGLPDTTKVREVARIRNPTYKGGSHEAFTYKHSDGRALFFTTVRGAPRADIYDLTKVVAGGDPAAGLAGSVPVPPGVVANPPRGGYHDFYVGYDPGSRQDRFYGAGWQSLAVGWRGYYTVYDVTRTDDPKLLVTITGTPGVDYAHTFTPTPDGRYAVAESEHQFQPLRIYDLKPALDGTVQTISRPIGAWTPNWRQLAHQTEVRWPYVFVAGYADGLHVFNMMDPTNPYTVGYYYSCDCPHPTGAAAHGMSGGQNGTWGIDVRNADGLIVLSDMQTGVWGFRMDGFTGWNGHQWGLPNASNAQDWDNGPDGAPKPTRVS